MQEYKGLLEKSPVVEFWPLYKKRETLDTHKYTCVLFVYGNVMLCAISGSLDLNTPELWVKENLLSFVKESIASIPL